jgi:hypothetical protein
MNLAHVFSALVLALTSLTVFWYFCAHLPFYNRLLWGFFLLPVALEAFVGMVLFLGYAPAQPLYQSLRILAGTLGMACVVVGAWHRLVAQTSIKPVGLVITLSIGVGLFVAVLLPEIQVFAPIVSAMAILVAMLIGVYGMLQRNHRAMWLVVAFLGLALAMKNPSFVPLNPLDFYNYTVSLSLLALGKGVQSSAS